MFEFLDLAFILLFYFFYTSMKRCGGITRIIFSKTRLLLPHDRMLKDVFRRRFNFLFNKAKSDIITFLCFKSYKLLFNQKSFQLINQLIKFFCKHHLFMFPCAEMHHHDNVMIIITESREFIL